MVLSLPSDLIEPLENSLNRLFLKGNVQLDRLDRFINKKKNETVLNTLLTNRAIFQKKSITVVKILIEQKQKTKG